MRVASCLLGLILGISGSLSAQEDKPRNWTLGGYLKSMQTGFFLNQAIPGGGAGNPFAQDTFLMDNLIHNRLNFNYYPGDRFHFNAELRTRVFYGDLVRANPEYAETVKQANNDYFNLSWILADQGSIVVHSMLDRLYLEYRHANWEVRLGRQRVNWGISTVWNPNDLFNAFDYTDFDYEERPGSDALRVKYYTGFAASVEGVISAFDNWQEARLGAKWNFNKWNYDIQLLAGLVHGDLAFGLGWAGNIGQAGLKGEMTWFQAMEEWFPGYEDPANAFAFTVGADYSFTNSLYLSLGYLYNSLGSTSASSAELFTFRLSAKNLYPYRHALFLQASYPVTPLVNAALAIIYSPVEVHPLFLNPTVTYNLATNWDIDLVGQISFNREKDRGYVSPVQALFFRLKWSF